MSDLVPLLHDIRGVYVDRARDRLPAGSVWEMVDWVPMILQAGARMRGAWVYQSPALTNPPDGMIFAPYLAGSKLLVANGPVLTDVPTDSVGATDIGAIPPTRQNPVFHRNRVIVPAADGTTLAKFVTWDGVGFGLTDAPSTSQPGKYATVWKDRVVLGNEVGQPQQVAYSKPGDPTLAWDSLSLVNTSYEVTGLASQRTQVLVFHASSVERLRGTTPPDSTLTDPTGDLILDVLWDRAGCYDARSIAYWQDNVLFCDARGIFLTDGAIVRNVIAQAGAINLWRRTWNRGNPISIAGQVHQDYYIATVRQTGYEPTTFTVDIPNRRVFTLGNIDSRCFAFSIGETERLFGTDQETSRVTDLTPLFNPDTTKLQIDDNGTPVLPRISSGWSTLTNKAGLKHVTDMHLSYQADRDDDVAVLQASVVKTPIGSDVRLGEFHTSSEYERKKIAVRRRMEGCAIKLEQLVPTKDSRLYDVSLRVYAEEQTRVAQI